MHGMNFQSSFDLKLLMVHFIKKSGLFTNQKSFSTEVTLLLKSKVTVSRIYTSAQKNGELAFFPRIELHGMDPDDF